MNLRSDDQSALRGVLVDGRGPVLLLADAELLTKGAEAPTRIDGQAAVDVSNVAWMQVLTSPAGA